MIAAGRALTIAQTYFISLTQHDDSAMIGPWREAVLGDPVLVRTVELEKSFWIVPVERSGQTLGHIDISSDGDIWGYAFFYSNPADLSVCPPFATRISAEEAREVAADILKTYTGGEFSSPVFVHDGPHNRLAWMIEVREKDKLASRVFVTPGYAYERRLDDELPSPGMRGVSA